MESFGETEFDMKTLIIERLRQFIEQEVRSCSMDMGCVTPLYVYRMWGGEVAMGDIIDAFKELK